MKSIVLGLAILASIPSFASNIITCEDPKDIYSQNNHMMIRETNAGAYKVLGLLVEGIDYLPDGSIYCKVSNGSTPIGGVAKGTEIVCDLPTGGLIASINYVDKGAGNVSIFSANQRVAGFSKFKCY